MLNRLAVPLAVGLGLAMALTAYGMGFFELECLRDAYLRRLDAENEVAQHFYNDVMSAREERRDRSADALQHTDDRERRNELRQIERDYNDLIREITRARRDADRDIRNQYNDDVRDCREAQKELCQSIQCERRRVPSCDREGNPIDYPRDPCDGQFSSASSRSSRFSSRRSSARFSFARSSSRRSSSRSSAFSSFMPICGDGICQGNESTVVCPSCFEPNWNNDDDDNGRSCRCHRVCEADCGRPN